MVQPGHIFVRMVYTVLIMVALPWSILFYLFDYICVSAVNNMLCITGRTVRVVWVLDVDGFKKHYKVGTHTSGKPVSELIFFS